MKKRLLLAVLAMLPACIAFAQGGYTLKAGGTYANLRAQGSTPDWGIALGIGREWRISKRTSLALEVMYTAKKTQLRNKTVAHEYYWVGGQAVNIFCDVRYLDIPLLWKYCRPLAKSVCVELYAGPSLEIAIKDQSRLEHLYNIDTPQRDLKYDYVFSQDDDPWPWFGRSGLNVNGGIGMHWSRFTFEFRYSRALNDVDVIAHTAMRKGLDSCQFLIGLKLK